eukprot:12119970-Alexandrium_andersonii.AAC.1
MCIRDRCRSCSSGDTGALRTCPICLLCWHSDCANALVERHRLPSGAHLLAQAFEEAITGGAIAGLPSMESVSTALATSQPV